MKLDCIYKISQCRLFCLFILFIQEINITNYGCSQSDRELYGVDQDKMLPMVPVNTQIFTSRWYKDHLHMVDVVFPFL
jgi:hypothetical protein